MNQPAATACQGAAHAISAQACGLRDGRKLLLLATLAGACSNPLPRRGVKGGIQGGKAALQPAPPLGVDSVNRFM